MLKFLLYLILFVIVFKAIESISKALSSDKNRNDNGRKTQKSEEKIINEEKGEFVDYEELE